MLPCKATFFIKYYKVDKDLKRRIYFLYIIDTVNVTVLLHRIINNHGHIIFMVHAYHFVEFPHVSCVLLFMTADKSQLNASASNISAQPASMAKKKSRDSQNTNELICVRVKLVRRRGFEYLCV